MSLLENPIVIGGILPMIFFGMMDFTFRLYAKKIPSQNVFFYTALGGFITTFFLIIFLFKIPFDQLLPLFSQKAITIGVILGIIWSISILSMGFAYEKLNANASQIIPIASSSAIFASLMGIIFLHEKISLPIFLIASFFIIIGIIFLAKAEANSKTMNKNLKNLFLSIAIGGFIPFFGFGILNILYKIFYELNIGVLCIMMSTTGIIISLILQKIRKQNFIHKPILLTSGVFWSFAVISLGYGFYPLLGNASLMLPIVGASPLISLFFVKIFLKENVNWNLVTIGAIIITLSLAGLNYWG